MAFLPVVTEESEDKAHAKIGGPRKLKFSGSRSLLLDVEK